MYAFHEASIEQKPSARTVQEYRKEVKRGDWNKLVDEMIKTVASISSNYRLRHCGRPLGENEGSKLYLFGKYLLKVFENYFQARINQFEWFDPFSKNMFFRKRKKY